MRGLLLAGLCGLSWCGLLSPLYGQAVSELPRADYYVARELFRMGGTREAAEGFKSAFNRARRVGDQRWIDSIPPLVMLGECYYQQGSLAAALEQYDAALMLALQHPQWTDQIEIADQQLVELEGFAKGIDWFAKSRPTRPVAIPQGIQIAIDPTAASVVAPGAVVAPVSLVTRLDATEVMRTMAIALTRRWQILGPLSQHSPMTEPLDALLARPPQQTAPWLQASWTALQGLGGLSSPTARDSKERLRAATLIRNEFDYYLSAHCLVVLASLEANEGKYQAAISNLQDATLLAAQFEQLDVLSEAIELMGACAAASQRVEQATPLLRVASWSNKRSPRVQAVALNAAAELMVYGGDLQQADRLVNQAAPVVRGRDVVLPRAQAQLSYTTALLAFAQDRRSYGLSNLATALKLMRGTSGSGAVVESVFQAQLALDLLAKGGLTAMQAEEILEVVLGEPNSAAWELRPLATMAAMTTSSLPAYERLVELAVVRHAPPELVLQRIDHLQRQRFFEALPLGGRLLAWRTAANTDLIDFDAPTRLVVEPILQRNPTLKNQLAQIKALASDLNDRGLPLDDRKVGSEAKRAFAELEGLAERTENRLAYLSLQRNALQRSLPSAASAESLQTLLQPEEMLLGFAIAGEQVLGVACRHDTIHVWHAGSLATLDPLLSSLLKEMGIVRQTPVLLPSAILPPNASWRSTATKLYSLLIPAQVQQMMDASEQLYVVPNGRLWYLPWESLPVDAKPGARPWISRFAISYVPTLGSLPLAMHERPALDETVGIVGDLFSPERALNQQLAAKLLGEVPNSHEVNLAQKVTIPSATWLKLTAEQLWVADEIDVPPSGWETIVLPMEKGKQTRLGAWLETPQSAPAHLLLPGMKVGLRGGAMRDGNEIFLSACATLFGGSRFALLSRWPVGGPSTQVLLSRYLQEVPDETAANAWRRAVLALWPEQFLIAEEPSLLPAGSEAADLCSGEHPLLWAGYLSVGGFRQSPPAP